MRVDDIDFVRVYMLPKYFKSYLVLFALVLLTSPAQALVEFRGGDQIEDCFKQFDDAQSYRSSLKDCYASHDIEIDDVALENISPNVTEIYEMLGLNREFASTTTSFEMLLGENTISNISSFISNSPEEIYNLHQNILNYQNNGLISPSHANSMIIGGYKSFDPVLLAQAGASQSVTDASSAPASTAAAGAVAGPGTVVVMGLIGTQVSDALDSGKKTATLSINDVTTSDESSANATFTVTINGQLPEDITVDYATSDVSATAGSDYTSTSGSLSISKGDTSASISVPVLDDSIYEGDETATITLSNISDSSVRFLAAVGTLTITEDEPAPVVTLAASSNSLAENSGSSITLTASLSQIADEDVTVSIGTSGTSTEGTDYASVSDITISAGSSSGTSTFTPSDDLIYEGDETAIISIDSVSGADATESGTQSETITITENESAPTLSLSTSASSVAENGSPLTLTATLSVATDEDVSVTFATSGTATSGTDYAALSLTVSAGDLTGTTSFTPSDDVVYEGDETAIIDVDSVSGGSATESGTQQVTITINENESAPTVTLSSSASSVDENGSALTLTATLSVATTADVTIALSASGSATEGTDYENLSNITVSAGSTTGTTSFTPTDDSVFEGDETATIDIDSVSGGSATESGTQQISIIIAENEDGPGLTIADVTTADESAANATFTVTMSPVSASAVTVDYATRDGTATAGSDYTSSSGTLTFSAGDATKTLTVPVLADAIYEGDETAIVTLLNVSGATIDDATATLTITDDDSAPTVTLSSSASSIAENAGSSLTLTATLSTVTTADVTVTLAATGTGTEGTDYSSLSSITISAGSLTGTTTFTPTDDSIYEGNETAIIAIDSVSGGSAVENGNQSTTITITEDDSSPTVTLSRSAASIAENAGSSLTITATLSTATTEDVTVTLSAAGTGTEGSDYISLSNITVSAGDLTGTTSFTPLDDSSDPVFEDSETAVIDIASVSGGSAAEDGTQQVTITITENESLTVTLSGTTSIDEKTETATITATASVKADATMSVSLSTAGTATSGTDYASLSNISISAGTTSGTTTFTPTNDTDYEGGSETAVISINSISGITASAAADTVTITITNEALNSGTQLTYSAANATSVANLAEFTNFNYSTTGGNSEQNPAEVHGFHKALGGYGLSGSGKRVAVVDDGFNNNHFELSEKTIATYGTLTSATGNSVSEDHGLGVMGVIGADYGDGGLVGMAYNVSFHVSDFNTHSETYFTDHLANLTADATSSITVAQNNSWGQDNTITQVQDLQSEYGLTANAAFSYYANSTTAGANSTGNLVNALNSFQSNGVIVHANSNTTSLSNSEMWAAMPQLFPQLSEAWISVVNIDIDGASGSETYSLKSAPCGDTAEYCLGGDAYEIRLLYNNGTSGNGLQWQNATGTSFMAPQVSAAVALLAEAFPNQSPEQWTDRLLASANNDLGSSFSHDGYVTFGNGVVHGYDTQTGHGILDVYAALQPITSNAYTASIYSGASNLDGERSELSKSSVVSPQSIGDGLSTALSGVSNYFYDALGGGFKYNMSGHVSQVAQNAQTINLDKEFSAFDSPANDNLSFASRLKFDGSVVDGTFDSDAHRFVTTVGSASPAIQSFFEFGANELASYSDYDTPYLTSKEGGAGVSYIGRLGDTRYFISYNKPVQEGLEGNVKGKQTSAVFAAESNITSNASLGVIGGSVAEDDAFLGLKGTEAFTLEGADSRTSFIGSKFGFKPSEDTKVSGMMTFGSSSMSRPDYGILSGAEKVKSSSFGLSLEKNNVFGNDTLAVSLSQPNRVDSGSMDVRLTNLSDSEGNLTYTNRSVSIAPSGRQKDLGVSYRRRVSDRLTLSAKLVATRELNHVKSAKDAASAFLGMKYGNLKLGATSSTHRKGFDAKASFAIKF